jgi:hypothetical protein
VGSASASPSSPEAPACLRPVYAARHQRTVDLVGQSIQILGRVGQRILLSSIVRTSEQIDPAGNGVSESAILHNDTARAPYEQHRTWKQLRRPRRPQGGRVAGDGGDRERRSSKVDSDPERARQRYMRIGNTDLVERVLAAEQAYADERDRWLKINDALFACMRMVDWLIAVAARSDRARRI